MGRILTGALLVSCLGVLGCCAVQPSYHPPVPPPFMEETIVAKAYPVLISRLFANRLSPLRPEALPAWELAYDGLALQNARESHANNAAQERLSQAIRREPGLVIAHFGLGLASYDEVLNQWGPREVALDRLTACARRCIELAPHAAEGYYLLGRHFQTLGDHGLAVQALESAIGHNPSFAPAHALLAQTLALTGRFDEGLARMKHALRLGPTSYLAGLSLFHFVRHEYAEALAAVETALATNPGYVFARAMAVACAWWLSDRAAVTTHLRELRRIAPNFTPTSFLRTFGPEVDGVERLARSLSAAVGDG